MDDDFPLILDAYAGVFDDEPAESVRVNNKTEFDDAVVRFGQLGYTVLGTRDLDEVNETQ